MFFFWYVNCTSQAFISQLILGNVLFDLFQYCIHKNFKTITLLLLAIFSDLKMTQFWSVNYTCQVCKQKLLFQRCPKFRTLFILLGSYLQLKLNIFYHKSTAILFETVLFDAFWRFCGYFCYLKKIFSKSFNIDGFELAE